MDEIIQELKNTGRDNKNVAECLCKIGELVDKRHSGEYHIDAETARAMIYDYIAECLEKIVREKMNDKRISNN